MVVTETKKTKVPKKTMVRSSESKIGSLHFSPALKVCICVYEQGYAKVPVNPPQDFLKKHTRDFKHSDSKQGQNGIAKFVESFPLT